MAPPRFYQTHSCYPCLGRSHLASSGRTRRPPNNRLRELLAQQDFAGECLGLADGRCRSANVARGLGGADVFEQVVPNAVPSDAGDFQANARERHVKQSGPTPGML